MVASKESLEDLLKELLQMLSCPVCKIKVYIKTDGSGFTCSKCHRTYPIIDEIPMMTIDEAIIEKLDDTPKINNNVC